MNICCTSLSVVRSFDRVFELLVNSLGIIRDCDVPYDIFLVYFNVSNFQKIFILIYVCVLCNLCLFCLLYVPYSTKQNIRCMYINRHRLKGLWVEYLSNKLYDLNQFINTTIDPCLLYFSLGINYEQPLV